MHDKWTVQEVINDMNDALRYNDACGSWSPIWDHVKLWRDQLVEADKLDESLSWVEVGTGRMWDSWLSRHSDGLVIDGSGVTFTGTVEGRKVARTYDGREWEKRS